MHKHGNLQIKTTDKMSKEDVYSHETKNTAQDWWYMYHQLHTQHVLKLGHTIC